MLGIKWSENEHNLLFPDEEDIKQPDVVHVNSLGCVQEEEDDNTEEDVKPFNDTMYVTNCSSFSSMSVYSSSALNNCLELSPIDSSDCFDPLCLVVCANCRCLNYEDYRYCINCLGLL